MHGVAEPALEPVGVQQGHEQLEVLLLPRVRGRGHQQQLPGMPAEQLTELVALGLLQLVAEVMGRHPVRLVDHHQVPVGVLQLVLQVVGAGELVHSRDEEGIFLEHPALGAFRVGDGVGELAGQQLEVQAELLQQLVLPLLDQAAWGDDQAALQVTAEHQLLDIQARHDRLARSRVVGQQEAERRAVQQFTVDSLDLVGERLQVRRLHREHRVEPARHADAEGLGGQLESGGVGFEVVSRAVLCSREPGLVVAIQEAFVELAFGGAVGEADRVGADPGGGDHGDRSVTDDAGNLSAWGDLFEPHSHVWSALPGHPARPSRS